MSQAFVWFHNASTDPKRTVGFYESLLDWNPAPGPNDMTMFAGASGPFAGVGGKDGEASGWIPYVQVDDLDKTSKRAIDLGAVLLQAKTRGPAGEFTIVRDPGGAAFALWQKA